MLRLRQPLKPKPGSTPSDQGLELDDPNGVEDRWETDDREQQKNQRSEFVSLDRDFNLQRNTFSFHRKAAFSASSRHMGLKGVVIRDSRNRNGAIMAQA